MKKILFLDLDGVLITDIVEKAAVEKLDKHGFSWESMSAMIHLIELLKQSKLYLLCNIVKETNCSIVITSSWRKNFTKEELKIIFAEAGFTYFQNIIDKTENCHNWILPKVHFPRIRGLEIKQWLDLNCRYERGKGFVNQEYTYCIVDDNSDMLLEQKDYLVKINPVTGLTINDVDKIIEILNDKK